VHPGRVVLEVSGRRETLSFPESGGVSIAEGEGLDALAALVAEGDPEGDLEEVAAASEPDQVIAWYRERLQEDPAQMLEDLGLEATDIGYAVGMTPAEEVARAGLRHGDVIVKVNGQQVGNIEADRELFDKVAASGHARIEVLRNGLPMVLSFPLR
jgi:general secretion pathway protein C